MRAYTLDLRERVVRFVNRGGTKAEAARRFALGRRTVYRYVAAAQTGTLPPKTSWGHWRKLDPQKLQAYVTKHPDATLKELQTMFGVSYQAVWVRLRQLGFTLETTHKILRTQQAAKVALLSSTGKNSRPARLLPGQKQCGLSLVS